MQYLFPSHDRIDEEEGKDDEKKGDELEDKGDKKVDSEDDKEKIMAKKFKPHPMYKGCKVKMAFKKEDHDKLEAKGYDHKKDPSCEKKK